MTVLDPPTSQYLASETGLYDEKLFRFIWRREENKTISLALLCYTLVAKCHNKDD